SLPDDAHTNGNAFADGQEKTSCPPCWHFGTGFIGLRRQGLGHGVIAMLDPGVGIDTGINPPNNVPTMLNFSDISPDFNWGTKATLSYRCGPGTIEMSGYYLGLTTAARQIALPGRLDLPFAAYNA